jgi:hypothetical protein
VDLDDEDVSLLPDHLIESAYKRKYTAGPRQMPQLAAKSDKQFVGVNATSHEGIIEKSSSFLKLITEYKNKWVLPRGE